MVNFASGGQGRKEGSWEAGKIGKRGESGERFGVLGGWGIWVPVSLTIDN